MYIYIYLCVCVPYCQGGSNWFPQDLEAVATPCFYVWVMFQTIRDLNTPESADGADTFITYSYNLNSICSAKYSK